MHELVVSTDNGTNAYGGSASELVDSAAFLVEGAQIMGVQVAMVLRDDYYRPLLEVRWPDVANKMGLA